MRAHEAANLLAGDDVNPEETDAPPFVRDMEGKSYTFQVKVGPYNFTANHQSFTISRILGEGERAPQPEFVEDGGDDDNGDDNDGAGLVRRKMKDGGCSKSAGPSAKSKKARKA
ncbi:BnaCnng62260D [Brassica napus]|uniref:BnaCnng62260D protein n=2 Tax=Brassica TaxID=3705 RepID=A0A078JNR5_BRANA|nr:BnaCnng62260D [Brassica napus]